MKSNNSNQIRQLERDLKFYDMKLKKDPEDANTLDLKGKAYVALADASGNPEFYHHALENFNRALEIEPESSDYLCDRAKLYATMGMAEKAIEDFRTLSKLASVNKGKDIVNDFYIQNTLKNIAKLDHIKGLIQQLKHDNKLSSEFVKTFDGFVQVAGRISIREGDWRPQLEEMWSVIDSMNTKLANHQDISGEIKVIKEMMVRQGEKIEELEDTFLSFKQASDEIKQQIAADAGINAQDRIAMQAKLNRIMKLVEKLPEQDTRIADITARMVKMTQQQAFTMDRLRDLEEDLESETEQRTGEYQAVTGRIDKVESELAKFRGEFKKAADETKSLIESGNTRNKEDLLDIVNNIEKKIELLANKDEVAIITKELLGLVNENKLTKGRLGDLEDQVDQMEERQGQAEQRLKGLEAEFAAFRQRADEFKAMIKADGEINQKDKAAMREKVDHLIKMTMELPDSGKIALVTERLTKLTKEQISNTKRLNDLEEEIEKLSNQSAINKVCMITDVVYDCELLNHAGLIKELGSIVSVSRLLKLGAELDADLIREAVNNDDSSIIIAGLISVDYSEII